MASIALSTVRVGRHHDDLRALGLATCPRSSRISSSPVRSGMRLSTISTSNKPAASRHTRVGGARDRRRPRSLRRRSARLQLLADLRFVVDEQDRCSCGYRCGLMWRCAAGRSMVTVGALRRGSGCVIVPAEALDDVAGDGQAEPDPVRRVVKYGSKMRGRSAAADPGPPVADDDGHPIGGVRMTPRSDDRLARLGEAAARGARRAATACRGVDQQVDQHLPQALGVGVDRDAGRGRPRPRHAAASVGHRRQRGALRRWRAGRPARCRTGSAARNRARRSPAG